MLRFVNVSTQCLPFPTFSYSVVPVFGGTRDALRFSFLCCVFCFICLRLVSFVPAVASFYGLFILDCSFGFLFLVFLFAFPLKKSIIQSVSDDDRIIFFIDVLMIGATKPWLSSFCIKSRFLRFYCYVHYVCG